MKLIPTSLTQSVGRHILVTQKNAPKWMFVAGIVGVVGSTVLACKATLKLEETLEDFKNDIDETKELRSKALAHRDGELVKVANNKDLAYVYMKGTYSIVRLYAPTILLGTASIGALTGSHVALTRRNASLTAAYSAVQMSFDAYRDRVREELGEEKELEFHHAVSTKQVVVDGKVEDIRMADPNKWSPYARFFDEASPSWNKNPELNRLYVQCQQNYANHLLQARGHVFLNEVYDMLGIDRSSAGQVVGWVMAGEGDHYIDFGLFEASSTRFVNGWERNILLDFNVDGVIYDKI
jgi:hypothetical protein